MEDPLYLSRVGMPFPSQGGIGAAGELVMGDEFVQLYSYICGMLLCAGIAQSIGLMFLSSVELAPKDVLSSPSVVGAEMCTSEARNLAKSAGVRHIAVTMDGNRRYGKCTYGSALRGHYDGAQALTRFTKGCVAHGVEILTVYAFSTENWNRASVEVDTLMNLITKYAAQMRRTAGEQQARVCVCSSDPSRLPPHVRADLDLLEKETAHYTAFQLNLCISYGGRGDIVNAARALAQDAMSGDISLEHIDEAALAARLTTGGLPDPDILLRTSGEFRLSNFLLWQCAYAELFFVDKLWPEMGEDDVKELLLQHMARRRRFGK